MSAIAQVFDGSGEPEPHYWVASYDNDGTLPLGVVAKQYANEPLTGGHYDLSVVADHWPGVDTPKEEDFLAALSDGDQLALIWRVHALVNGLPEVADGPTKGEVNQLAIGLDNFKALIWRVDALLGNLDAVADGPAKGEVNQLKAELAAIKAGAGVAPHTHTVTGTAS